MNVKAPTPIAYRRLATALFVVAALIAAAPLSSVLAGKANTANTVVFPPAGMRAHALAQAEDAESAVSQLESMARAEGGKPVPPWFDREIGFLPGSRDARVDGGTVVGFLVDGTCDDVCAALIAHMQARGWTSVPLGEVEGATFMKQSGICTWTLATCTQVGSATSVVLRCNAS